MTRRAQTFTAPGTWSCPPTTKSVEVFLVGGGGGLSRHARNPLAPPTNPYSAGGGGGVRTVVVPVSGPVPVTVGAGGTNGVVPAPLPAQGTAGGSSSFGPVSVGGGAAGYSDAPPDGGGGGSNSPGSPTAGGGYFNGGLYGGGTYVDGAAGSGGRRIEGAVYGNSQQPEVLPSGIDGYGCGGASSNAAFWYNQQSLGNAGTVSDNTGAGAGGSITSTAKSGVVIVRWFE